ncbi:MAG: DUF2628 domain-containing protein [Nitrospira sp.]|nr:DUF2628 domain-containing protein [Nitrospira sp.]
MKLCDRCRQQNADDAKFCAQCGTAFAMTSPADPVERTAANEAPEAAPAAAPASDQKLWRQFIGPNADRYLEQFKKFSANGQPKFALSWNWPAFLFISFLWFLYRKMYMHAAVYAIGPMASTYITGDMTVGLVWSIMAGATANYLYYWHCKEEIAEIKKAGKLNPAAQEAALKEAGGVQPYVIYVGIVLYVIALAGLAKMIEEGQLDGDKIPTRPTKPVSTIST